MKLPKKPQPQPHLKIVQETLDQFISHITSKMRSEQPQFYSGQIIKRRVNAIKDTTNLVSAKHDLAVLSEGYTNTAEMWALANLCISGTPEDPDEPRNIALGAAIWILDHVEGEITLPPVFEDIPDLYDPAHDDDLLRATVHLIRNRRNDPEDFNALLSRIPEENRSAAAAAFEDALWEWVDHLFDFVKPIAKRIGELVRIYNQNIDEFNAGLKKLDQHLPVLETKRPNPLLVNPFGDLSSASPGKSPINFGVELTINRIHSLETLTDRLIDLQVKIEEAYKQLSLAIGLPIDLSFIHTRPYEREHPELLQGEFPMFVPSDPYELCFAYYELARKDSPLLWLWGACLGLINQVGKNLPWGLSPYYDYSVPTSKKPVKLPLPHLMEYFTEGQDYPVSFTQLVYNLGGGLLPRNWDASTGWSNYLGKVGLKDRKTAIALISVFQAIRNRNALAPVEEEEKEEIFTSEDINELNEIIRSLQKQLKQATDEAHAQKRRALKAEQILETEREKSRSDRKELADLREVLFMDEREDAGTTLPLPYTVHSRIVVYGGHDTWLKAMKEYVKGEIRFVDKDQAILDRSVIRNADTVWIQHNALPHSQYYAIIDEVRKTGKQVKYFLYASAKKCVEQIAKDEVEG